MATDVEDLIFQLNKMTGWRYNQAPCRLDGDEACGTDCSGSQYIGYSWATGVNPGGTVSSSMARWCYEAGLEVPVEIGKTIRGAWVFWGPDRGLEGFGNNGHIVTSLGDGTCIGTPGYNGVFGIVPWEFFGSYQPSGAAYIPGIMYGSDPHPPSSKPDGQKPLQQGDKMNWIVPVDEGDDKPVFWFTQDGGQRFGTYIGESGTEGFIIKTLQDAGEKVYTSAQPVTVDFKKSFRIDRDFVKPKP